MDQPVSGCKMHPMVLFWIGVLTGALVVGILFLYGTYQTQNLQDRLLQSGKILPSTTTTTTTAPSAQGPGV